MVRIHRLLHALQSAPPHVLARRLGARIIRAIATRRRRRADLDQNTYLRWPQTSALTTYWRLTDIQLSPPDLLALRETSAHHLRHGFDLLGSGWVTVQHGMSCQGLDGRLYPPAPPARPDPDGDWLRGRINAANLERARQVWKLVDLDYTPIDWHLDFKSGYRWNESTWYRDIRFGDTPGADVKVPWELARMQHLPRLAMAHALALGNTQGFQPAKVYAREFRNQVLDFIATNPPRFGVHWYSTMDVAIRAANWLVAYDMLRSAGAAWDKAFDEEFIASIWAHGRHIVGNLDWNATWRGNHYLANVVGLLFVAAYLPSCASADAWLAFSIDQLVDEVGNQFALDGSNFEASTSYHRLSAEMAAYGTALVLALPPQRRRALDLYDHRLMPGRPALPPAPLPRYALPGGRGDSPFPAWYFERLERCAEFTCHVTKPTLRIHQVGDNDNGHFLNLLPVYQRRTNAEARARLANLVHDKESPSLASDWAEEHLDHRPLIAAFAGLFDRPDLADFCGPGRIETTLVRKLIGGVGLAPCLPVEGRPRAATISVGDESCWQEIQGWSMSRRRRRSVCRICLPAAEIGSCVERHAYPDFGLYIWRSHRFYLAVRCGPQFHLGCAAHAHNDQLAVELTMDDRDVLLDPGTYLYTPAPKQRNLYRSVAAHCAPRPGDGREPGRLDLNVFALCDRAKARCLYFGPRGFAGTHQGYGTPIYRTIEIEPMAIVVTDYSDRELALDERWPYRIVGQGEAPLPFSPGYGSVVAPAFEPCRLTEIARTLSSDGFLESRTLRVDAAAEGPAAHIDWAGTRPTDAMHLASCKNQIVADVESQSRGDHREETP